LDYRRGFDAREGSRWEVEAALRCLSFAMLTGGSRYLRTHQS
jgi:hypothetical protein